MGLAVILRDYQQGIADLLTAEFTSTPPPNVEVVVEDQSDPADATIDTVQAVLDGDVGIILVVGAPKVQRQEQSRVTITSTCDIIENVKKNRSAGGTGVHAIDGALTAWAALDGKQITSNSGQFTALRPTRIEQAAADDGLVVWEIDVESTSHFYVTTT